MSNRSCLILPTAFVRSRFIKAAEVKDTAAGLEVGSWTLKGGLRLKDDLFPHVSGGLRGKTIKIASFDVTSILWALSIAPEAGLLNKRLMLSSSISCDQNYKYKLYDLGHTLLCYLSRT